MFEYNGKIFSLELLQEKAALEGLSLDDYLKANPDIKKIEDTNESLENAQEIADATAVNQQIASGRTTDDTDIKIDKINKINKNFSKDIEGLTTDTIPLTVAETRDFTQYIDDLEKQASAERFRQEEEGGIKSELIDTAFNLESVISNMPKDLQSHYYSALASGLQFIQKAAGDDVADFLIGERGTGSIAYIDPESKEQIIFDENPEKWKELNRINQGAGYIEQVYADTGVKVGEAADEKWLELIKSSEKFSKERGDTGKGIVKGIRKGDFSDIVGGVFNGIGSVLTTFVPAVLTRGMSLAPQIVAPIVTDFNVEKAKTLYPDAEDPIRQLAFNDEIDMTTPLIMGTLAAGLEYVGIKGISSAIAKSAWNWRGMGTLLLAGGREGTTEWFQHGIEETSLGLARGEDELTALEGGLNSMMTDQGLESLLQGFVGGIALGGGGAKVVRALRNDNNGVKTVNSSINKLYHLTLQKNSETNKTAKELIEQEISNTTSELKTYLETNKKLASFMTNEQQNELINLLDQRDKLYQQGIQLRNDKQNNKISNKGYGYAIRSINNQAKKIANDIYNIKTSVNTQFVEKEIETVVKVGAKLSIKKPEVLDNKQFIKRIDELNFSKKDTQDALNSEGFILDDGTILINKERAIAVGNISVGSHELLHRIIQNDLSDPVRRKQIIDEFIDQLSTKERAIVEKRIEESYKYNEDGTEKDISKYNEEYLTAFSDALALGEISYNESLFTKLMKPLTNIFKRYGYKNAKFQSGKDVYNFIKEYQREIKKGKLSTRAEELSKIKPTKTDKKSTLKTSKTTPRAQEFIDLNKEGVITNEGLVEIINSPSSSSIDKFGAIEAIVEGNWPVISNAIKFNPTGKIPIDAVKTAITEQIQGIFPGRNIPLFKEFDKLKSKVTTVLGPKFLGKRQAEILERAKKIGGVTQEGMSIDSKEAKQVADTTTEKTTEKPRPKKVKESLRKKIQLTEDLINKVKNAVRKTFGTKLPPITSPKFKKALQKSYKRELFKDIKNMMGTRAKYQEFLGDNFEAIYDALPQEVINKRFPDFFERVLNKEGKQQREDTAQGNAKFDKKKIVKAEFIKYFNPPAINPKTGKKSGKAGTRKDALAETLAQEYAFDATMETAQEPAILEKFKNILKLQDFVVENEIELVSKQIERNPNLKFSRSQKIFKRDSYKLLDLVQKNNIEDIFNEEGELIGKYTNIVVDEARDLIWSVYEQGIIDDQKGLRYKELIFANKNISQDIKKQLIAQGSALSSKSDINKRKTLHESNKVIAKALPSEVVDVLGTDVFGYINRVLDPAQKKVDEEATLKNKQKVAEELSKKLKRKITLKELATMKEGKGLTVYQKGVTGDFYQGREDFLEISKNSKVKLPEDIKLEDIRLMNKKFPLFKKISKIQASNASTKIKLKQLKELRPEIKAANKANIKLANYIVNTIGNLYLDGKIDAISVLNLLQLQTNAIGGIRALTTLEFLSLDLQGKLTKKDGNYIELKGEHLAPSANSMAKLAEIILNKNKPSKEFLKNEIAKVFKDHTQLLTTQALTDIIDKGGKNNPTNRDRIKFLERKDINNIVNFEGKSYEETMVDYAILEAREQALEKSEQKAKVYNEKILPPVIEGKFSKSTSNQEVLNEMQTLDTEAQNARIKYSKSKDLNKDFNEILERATGIGKEKQYGRTKAKAVGATKGKWNWVGIPPSAQDFVGLTRYFAGKGKQGDATIAWIKENFLDPFARGSIDISNARVALANDYKALKKLLKVNNKVLNEKITGEPYTIGNALRVYTWTQQGMTVPGLSKADTKILNDYIANDPNLVNFANELIAINKDNGYPKPTKGWMAGTITTDLLTGLNTVVRAKYLTQWQNNVDQVFTEANMNKLEAAFGKGYRDALENMLGRMKTGSNRGFKGDTLTGRFIDWINGSVGAIMFFNMRSAVLQTISAINFVNWTDNNPLKAAQAFANQPQFWRDVVNLMNSDYLVERRNGLKINVSEADIAEIAAESKNKAKAFIHKLLKLGFLPTQIADSFAIATGGATFYRNRLKTYIKEGLSEQEAKDKAFKDFREISEENQQSSRPDRISKQQAGPMGRVILAFANTPAQYARIMQKAVSDLKNRRGDAKSNVSKIIYYGIIQNVIFNALQQALFAMAFDDEEPDEEKKNKKYIGIANGMADSLLRGAGFHGAAISAVKGALLKMADGGKAQDAAIELLDISPTVSSKIGKMRSAGRTWDWNQKEIREKGWSLDNPAWLASGQVVSASTNIPLDRLIRKLDNIKDASDANNAEWMRVANALGWAKWELEWTKDKKSSIKKTKIKSRGNFRKSSLRSTSRRKTYQRR